MKLTHHITVCSLAALALLLTPARAQNPKTPTPDEVGAALGFTDAEIQQIKSGQIIKKALKEGSDKELAGVVAVVLHKPVSELVDIALQGKMLETSPDIQAFRVWKPDAPADKVFADLGLSATETDEARLYANAAPGSKLNLSAADVQLFQGVNSDPQSVNDKLRIMLRARYDVYRRQGLEGIAPYTRGGSNVSSPAKELTLAINETMAAARLPDFFQALLSYPAKPLPDTEHRFYWFKSKVENRPTFILAHRTARHTETAALLTEEQIYVSHSYNSNFIAGGCLAVQGGTLVFYVNRTFTDQVAGWGSGMKHSIGRGQMLDEVVASLQRIRDHLVK